MAYATVYWYRADSLLSKLIRLVTGSQYSHVAIYVDGRVYEAVGDGLFCWDDTDADARVERAVAFRTLVLDDRAKDFMVLWLDKITDATRKPTHPILGGYSILGFLTAGIGALTRVRVYAGKDGEFICSGLVATALFRAFIDMPHDPKTMTPEDLAELLQPNAIAR